MNLLLTKHNDITKISGSSLEYLNHEKNKIELETNELFDVCFFSIDEHKLSELPAKLPPKTIKVFDKKTIKVRNDDEQWNDVRILNDVGGVDRKTSTVLPQPNIQKDNDIVKDYLTFQPMTIFTPDYWYCNSVEFTAISQYYKSGYDTFAKKYWELWYELQGQYLITQKEKKYLPFVNYIKRLGFNYE